jgi:hypothetical protein
MNPFQSLRDYEEFVYTLRQQFPVVTGSTLVLIQRGKRTALVQGDITFADGYRVNVKERLSLDTDAVLIEDYGYELWHKGEKIAWYDSQPHPQDPTLKSTHPHHKHIPPDIKRNRIPAPNMSFIKPNLPALIREIEALIK